MSTIGNHGLSCLDDNNYAAIALSMQSNARAIDASLFQISTSLTAYGNRYVSKTVRTTTSTSGANSGTGLPDGTAADDFIFGGGLLPQGWYAAALTFTYQETGAVTAGSYRRGIILINGIETKIPPTFYQSITVATNTGAADSMTVNAWFYSDGILRTTVTGAFGHGNTGSTMTVAAGAILTVRFLDTGLVT